MLQLYNILLIAGIILGLPIIIPFLLFAKKRRRTVLPRLGLAGKKLCWSLENSRQKPEKPIWIHALSVGEARSAFPLIEELADRFARRPILLSVSTLTAFGFAETHGRGLWDGLFYFPYDLPPSIRTVVDKLDPAAVLIVESDIWPNFLSAMNKREIPVILCNGRLSDRSFARYRRLPFVADKLYAGFTAICVQSKADAERLMSLNISPGKIHQTGNVKFDQEPVAIDSEERRLWKKELDVTDQQPVLLAGSTHKGEERIVLQAFKKIRAEASDLCLIIAPRNPNRAPSILKLCLKHGFVATVHKNLAREHKDENWDILVIDAIGILNRLYTIADVAFVGGSLVKGGGHNPLEPAAYAKAMLFGPDMSDFADISKKLVSAGGAVQVESADEFYAQAVALLNDTQKAASVGRCAYDVFMENRGAVAKTLKVVENCLP